MRKTLRFLLLAVALFAMSSANALDMQCFPAEFVYVPSINGWRCEFTTVGNQCLVCYAVIVVQG